MLTLLCPGALASALLPESTSIGGDDAQAWPAAWRDVDEIGRFELDAVGARELPHEAWLRERFAIPGSAGVAAASALVDEQALPTWRLTPACVQTGRDQLMLLDPATLGLSVPEADSLADSLRPWIEEDGWTLTVATPGRWYLNRQDGSAPPAFPVHGSGAAQGRAIDAYMPFDLAARPWRRLLNEIQMLWHEHPTNLSRMASGQPPANTLWLEGAWTETRSDTRPFDTIITGDPALAGLARLSGAELRWQAPGEARPPLPDGAPSGGARTLVELDFWGVAAGMDGQAFSASWHRLREWLARSGLLERPGQGRSGLELILTGERRCVALRVRPHTAWRFWRRADPDRWLERLERPPALPMPTDAGAGSPPAGGGRG